MKIMWATVVGLFVFTIITSVLSVFALVGVAAVGSSKTEVKPNTVYQQRVKGDIRKVGDDVGRHRNLGISACTLCGVDYHTEGGKHQAYHRDSEIDQRVFEGILVSARKIEQGLGYDDGGTAKHDGKNRNKPQRLI